ncbi:2,3-diaminopropionate biosynthesis protein SbnA [Streptomyces sp. CA-250714]|uniref:2,3-diaminopropionate biosynthesis protein SbnA n=1 Tax=Streptomyces sp. CA-250714 TaxID=3240060 RepID=UPI003D8BE8E2
MPIRRIRWLCCLLIASVIVGCGNSEIVGGHFGLVGAMIAERVADIVVDNVFLRATDVVPGCELFLKFEGLNPAGSVKLKTAVSLVEHAERSGALRPGGRIIESSSGNLGIALSLVCAERGYRFTCVCDPNVPELSVAFMRATGAEVFRVDRRDGNGGFLQSRIEYIRQRITEDAGLVWLNQYANPANPAAHSSRTAKSIHAELGRVDYLFVGAGTTGTLVGCADYFRVHSPRTRIVAVDTVGSVTFGHPPGVRYVPGLGTSRRPELCQGLHVDRVVQVEEADAVRACRTWAQERGLLLGGSSGSVLHAVESLGAELSAGSRIVALSPDFGDRYLSTVYDDDWVAGHFSSVPPGVAVG